MRVPSIGLGHPFLACLLGSCSIVQPLEDRAWAAHSKGEFGIVGRFGVLDDFAATSSMTADTNFGEVQFDVGTDLTGTLGLLLGGELFIADNVSLQLGVDYRRFNPEPVEPFQFDTMSVTEYYFSSRWMLPYPVFGQERLRQFLEVKLGLRPETTFDSTVELIPGSAPAVYQFRGSPSWGLGLATGLAYQLQDRLVGYLHVVYEWPLTESEDAVAMDVLPGFPPIVLDSELDSRGAMALFGISYYF